MLRTGCVGAVAGLLLVACGQGGDAESQQAADNEVLPATESYKVFGDHVVHFNAVPTVDLDANITSEYEIIRSNDRIMLLVNIRRGTEEGFDVAIPGQVRASATNLTGQLRNLPTREIRESNTIYYIAETQIENGETLTFTVEATPEDMTEPLVVRFQKQFFVDG